VKFQKVKKKRMKNATQSMAGVLHAVIWRMKENHESIRLLERLVSVGFSLNAQDHHGNTPAHIAVMMIKPKFLRILLDGRPNMSIRNSMDMTPGDIAYIWSVSDCQYCLYVNIQT